MYDDYHNRRKEVGLGGAIFSFLILAVVVAYLDLESGGHKIAFALQVIQMLQSWYASLSSPASGNSVAGSGLPLGMQCLIIIGMVIFTAILLRVMGTSMNGNKTLKSETSTKDDKPVPTGVGFEQRQRDRQRNTFESMENDT